ncbi:uncharacterized protein [Cicer arietinum]|uniref:Uncharacterized protein LOC101510107 isoform X2 n=1 Tax=Cicer arietinum TaxID=3827 RepID=A0A1S2XJY8_CICAR|nr:uncharacterized protein LOC101510107 isoform X2 [Cicer arietinum]
MILWNVYQQLVELFVSSMLILFYGFYIFGTGVAQDLSHSMVQNYETDVTHPKDDDDMPPIVFVHGFFGFGSFGKRRLNALSHFVERKNKQRRVLVPDFGCLTSIYDRAREMFYYLKGGQVDYGEEHSKACGHSQFGQIYERGFYPKWDEDHPVHFVGHSAGAQVIRVLQQMLADKAFKGYENTTENWVLSITSLSGAINGTTRTYLDGMRPEDGRKLKPICLLQLCRIGVIMNEWVDISWLKKYQNFGLDHFNMSWRKMGLRGLVNCLLDNVGPFASEDWILPDLTIQGSIKINNYINTFPNTYYFSYAIKRTWKIMGNTVHSCKLRIHPLLFLRVLQMSQWCCSSQGSLPYKGYRNEDWQESDGEINTISMTHPRFPIEHPSHLVEQDSDYETLQPGIWYYKLVEGDHIAFVVNREKEEGPFDLIYDTIFERCRKLVFRKKFVTLPNQV